MTRMWRKRPDFSDFVRENLPHPRHPRSIVSVAFIVGLEEKNRGKKETANNYVSPDSGS